MSARAPHREVEASGTREERPLASPNIYASVEEQLRHDPRLYHAYMLGRQDAPTPPEADRALLDAIRTRCRVVYYPPDGAYPIEHAPGADKDSWDEIVAALAPRPTPEDRTDGQ